MSGQSVVMIILRILFLSYFWNKMCTSLFTNLLWKGLMEWGHEQCEQMARWFFIFGFQQQMKNLPFRLKICLIWFIILPNTKLTLKKLPKWRIFTKFGHTGLNTWHDGGGGDSKRGQLPCSDTPNPEEILLRWNFH